MKVIVVGGGPAGLRAAEVAANGGAQVTLFDAKASVGRKFLVAGRGGLNLTKDETADVMAKSYLSDGIEEEWWREVIGEFDSTSLRGWAEGLGAETFVASTGRVYPRELKGASLLRRWVKRLKELGVDFLMNHRFRGLSMGNNKVRVMFETEQGKMEYEADAAILALGGGSWPQTGSDGGWLNVFSKIGIAVTPLAPANSGWECEWPAAVLAVAEGKPLKNIVISANGRSATGELLVAKYGLEGGAIYELGPALRAMENPVVTIDFKPSSSREKLVAKMESVRRNYLEEARGRWRLSDAAFTIIAESSHAPFESVAALAEKVKAFAIPLTRPRPLAEAISSAGGVRWRELDRGLMLKKFPGIFIAGEMIDWEAPTGGYLLHGCFATANRAAASALKWLHRPRNA